MEMRRKKDAFNLESHLSGSWVFFVSESVLCPWWLTVSAKAWWCGHWEVEGQIWV